MRSVCIIPARSGSKRIPNKNVRPFRGKPIIAYSIETALTSKLFSTVMVSTDDAKIAEIARSFGAEVPFMRSPENSTDHSTTADVLLEVLEAYLDRNTQFDLACNLYATSPFTTVKDLQAGLETLLSGPFDAILPITEFDYPILRSLKRAEDGRIEMNWPDHINSRSQDLPRSFHDAGQWAFFKSDAFLSNRNLFSSNTGSVLLPRTRVQDIDTTDDWIIAEIKHRILFEEIQNA